MTEEALVRAKSVALIEKTKHRLAQIDSATFPTDASSAARHLLSSTLDVVAKAATSPAVSPEALYNGLIRFQDLVRDVEASSSEHVSWPMVSYCDHIWMALFPAGDRQIFYSVTNEHNYTISSFSRSLELLLTPILQESERKALLGTQVLYCLQLASLEEENLPLYAIIGHEFGHAVFYAYEKELKQILADEIISALKLMVGDFSNIDPHSSSRRGVKTAKVIVAIATELFCDLVGHLICGPAFLLSLYEMSWGSDANRWTGRLFSRVGGYPSFAFRLRCLMQQAALTAYEVDASKAFQRLDTPALKTVGAYASSLPADDAKDQVIVSPDSDPDRDAIQRVLIAHLADLKTGLKAFLQRCDEEFLPTYKAKQQFAPVSADHVAALLHRLEHDILPNIIPDNTLLGLPATFSAILNSSAIYRVVALRDAATRAAAAGGIYRDLQKTERLTAKAFEVSYIQREFRAWQGNQPK